MLTLLAKIELVEDYDLVLPPVPVPWGLYAAIAAGVLLAAGALWWWLGRLRKKGQLGPAPEVVALRALAKLHEDLPKTEPMDYALRVSQIMREYIEGQFGLRAPTRSTEEFLLEAERSALLEPADQRSVGELLKRCDTVKFALGALAMDGKIRLHDEAKKFVEVSAAAKAREREEAARLAKAAKKSGTPVEAGAAPVAAPSVLAYSTVAEVPIPEPHGPPPSEASLQAAEATEEEFPTLNPRETVVR